MAQDDHRHLRRRQLHHLNHRGEWRRVIRSVGSQLPTLSRACQSQPASHTLTGMSVAASFPHSDGHSQPASHTLTGTSVAASFPHSHGHVSRSQLHHLNHQGEWRRVKPSQLSTLSSWARWLPLEAVMNPSRRCMYPGAYALLAGEWDTRRCEGRCGDALRLLWNETGCCGMLTVVECN
eukprot:363519-Chlamydomonas_euryale.AAC.3